MTGGGGEESPAVKPLDQLPPYSLTGHVKSGEETTAKPVLISILRGHSHVYVNMLVGADQVQLRLPPRMAFDLAGRLAGCAREIEYKCSYCECLTES